jgi:hypothetical protein
MDFKRHLYGIGVYSMLLLHLRYPSEMLSVLARQEAVIRRVTEPGRWDKFMEPMHAEVKRIAIHDNNDLKRLSVAMVILSGIASEFEHYTPPGKYFVEDLRGLARNSKLAALEVRGSAGLYRPLIKEIGDLVRHIMMRSANAAYFGEAQGELEQAFDDVFILLAPVQ